MFEDTHQFNSNMAQTLRHPGQTVSAIVNELDTSFNQGYDEPGANMYQLQNISQHMKSTLNTNFDYGYLEWEEGTSVKNFKRKSQFNYLVDHLHNPLNKTMGEFFKGTYYPKHGVDRDTSIDQASKELER